jgi:hypothetical protein
MHTNRMTNILLLIIAIFLGVLAFKDVSQMVISPAVAQTGQSAVTMIRGCFVQNRGPSATFYSESDCVPKPVAVDRQGYLLVKSAQ